MEFTQFANEILLPFGGTTAALIGLTSYLSNLISKRIINGDLAKEPANKPSYSQV